MSSRWPGELICQKCAPAEIGHGNGGVREVGLLNGTFHQLHGGTHRHTSLSSSLFVVPFPALTFATHDRRPLPPASLCSPPVLSRTIIPLRADARTHKQRVNARGETTQKKRGGQKGGGGQSRAQTQGVKGEDSYVSRMHARARARMTHAFMNGRFSSGLLARSRARGSERAGARALVQWSTGNAWLHPVSVSTELAA